LRSMVWGGRRLEKDLGKLLPTAQPYGESWEISDHPINRSVVACGAQAGKSLRQLMEEDRAALLGPAVRTYSTFPWLVQFLDCSDWLSVQGHPDETAVERLWPGVGSKSEAWFVVGVEPGSRVLVGL